MTDTKPISSNEFESLMKELGIGPEKGPFAVAVSGGADSMALALLAGEFASVHYLTFDHGLRPESANEARRVGKWLRKKGQKHTILTWRGEKPSTGLQEAARRARYKALEGWCKNKHLRFLLLAHHLEDQAETVLMRLFKGSGLDGLSAMSGRTPGLFESEIALLRPLLDIPKARLEATLKAQNQDWIEDPANENSDFTRVKIRKALKKSPALPPETLAGLATRLYRVRAFLDDLTGSLLSHALEIKPEGYALLELAELKKAPPEIVIRGLSLVLKFISQADYPPPLVKLERLYKALKRQNFKGATLHGCRLNPLDSKEIVISREAADIRQNLTLKAGEKGFWDRRFAVEFKGSRGPLEVKPLGEEGWQRLAGENPGLKKIDIPHPARTSLPAFFRENEPVLVPHLNFAQKNYSGRADFNPKRSIFV